MNRWKKAALLCAIIAAMSNSSPVLAGLDRNTVKAESAAIKVSRHFPADMAVGISPEIPLTVEFSGAVNTSFYQTINLNLFKGTDPVEGELFYNPSARQIMFKPKTRLEAGQTYTAQLSYYDGLGRISEKVWSFQTEGGNNNFQPTPTVSAQVNQSAETAGSESFLNIATANMGSGQVNPDTPLEVTFTEPLDIVSLKTAPVKLFENNQQVGIDYKLSRDLKTLTISTRKALKPGAAYAIAIDQNLAATSGHKLRKKTLIPFKLAEAQPQVQVAQHEIEESAPVNRAPENPFSEQPQNMVPAQPTSRQPRTQPPAKPAQQVQLIGLSPVNGARVTNLTQPITIGFSDEIRPETLNEFTFRLEDDFGPVPAKIHYFKGHKQATLTPIGLLESNKTYRVVVTQGITDVAGRPIRSGINSMFSTVSPVSTPAMPEMMANRPPEADAAELESFDNRGEIAPLRQTVPQRQVVAENQVMQQRTQRQKRVPVNRSVMSAAAPADRRVRTGIRERQTALNPFKVTAIYPGADNQNVSRKSKIAVHFSEAADPSTINNINISVFANQSRVDGKVFYDRRKNRAIFEPTAPLDANTQYKVIVNDKIKSKMGESLASSFSWQFSTAEKIRHIYSPKQTAEADAAFYIPLVDSKLKKSPGQEASKIKVNDKVSGAAFNFVDPKHWAFKSMRHITNKGILNNFPFAYTDSVTRYEFASAINLALNNLKTMQYMASRPKLKIADMVELQQLIVEFRSELKSYAVNTHWFENFLERQGVNLRAVEMKVKKMNNS
ncbi:MAG: hypothetical protein Kow0029_21080 [Candidatus Rifleibacteriota bacterium]